MSTDNPFLSDSAVRLYVTLVKLRRKRSSHSENGQDGTKSLKIRRIVCENGKEECEIRAWVYRLEDGTVYLKEGIQAGNGSNEY